jgi:plasmid maintenance system antidote protein VapI
MDLLGNIKAAIATPGKSRKTIAEEIGMPYNQLWRFLTGRRALKANFIAQIAIATGKTPNELYGLNSPDANSIS